MRISSNDILVTELRISLSFSELVKSIESYDIFQEIGVVQIDTWNKYLIIDGVSRFFALLVLGRENIPCCVHYDLSVDKGKKIRALMSGNRMEVFDSIEYLRRRGISDPLIYLYRGE